MNLTTLTNGSRYFFLLVIFIAASSADGQVTSPVVTSLIKERSEQSQRTKDRDDYNLRINQENRERNLRTRNNQTTSRRSLNLDTKIIEDIEKRLIVSQNDYVKYDSFLKSPKTGIFKFLLSEDCSVIPKKEEQSECSEKKSLIEYFAGSYSLRDRKYKSSVSADFSLVQNRLSAKQSEFQIIIANLGDVPLENLTLDSDGISYLRDFKPATQITEVKKQFKLFAEGVSDGGYNYSKSEILKLNNTYVIRTIAYDGNKYITTNEASDLIVVVKLIGYEKNDSITFVWKELVSKRSPTLLYK